MNENRDTLGMPDVLDSYPVAPPRSLDGVLGFELLEAGPNFVRGQVVVSERICQRFGLVHGGVYASLAEMLATEATVHNVWADGKVAVGMSNNTSFLRPITKGTVHAVGQALHRGATTWVWQLELLDDEDRRCAVSTVTIAVRDRR